MNSVNLRPNIVYKLNLPFRFLKKARVRMIEEIIPLYLQERNSG
jgi:hypothetical protein